MVFDIFFYHTIILSSKTPFLYFIHRPSLFYPIGAYNDISHNESHECTTDDYQNRLLIAAPVAASSSHAARTSLL